MGSNALDAPLPNGRSPPLHCPHLHPRCFTLPTGQGRGAATGAGGQEQPARYHVWHAHGKPLGQPCAASPHSMHATRTHRARGRTRRASRSIRGIGGSRPRARRPGSHCGVRCVAQNANRRPRRIVGTRCWPAAAASRWALSRARPTLALSSSDLPCAARPRVMQTPRCRVQTLRGNGTRGSVWEARATMRRVRVVRRRRLRRARWARWSRHVQTWCLLWPTTGRLRRSHPRPNRPSARQSLRPRALPATLRDACYLMPSLILTRSLESARWMSCEAARR